MAYYKASHASDTAGRSLVLRYSPPAPQSATGVRVVLRGAGSGNASSDRLRRRMGPPAAMTAATAGPVYLRTGEHELASRRIWKLKGQLESLTRLTRGWDSYDADPPNATAMRNARVLLHALVSRGTDVLPTTPSGKS